MGLNHPRYSLFVKTNRALRWGARFFLCGREAVTAKDGVGFGRRNNELNEFLWGVRLGRKTTNFIVGLRRRNNELNELTNFFGA